MAEEQPKQPRKVRDLKARLGRTIAPGVQPIGGGDASATPPAGDGPIPPPANLAPSGPVPGGPSVVVPPFLQKQKKRSGSNDPFAAGEEPTGPREVRLVLDDSAVAESETGKAARRGLIGAVAVAALVAIVVGYGTGSAMGERRIHNGSVQAAKRIHEAVSQAEPALEKVETELTKAMAAVRGGSGKAPGVDFEALAGLRAIENPFQAAQFSRESYQQFNANATDALFSYYMKTQELFADISRITSRAQSRKEALLESAASANSLTTDQTGCVPVIENQRIFCGLVYVEPPEAVEGQAPSPMLNVRSTKSGRPAQREIYTGQNIIENSGKFVILTNTAASVGVLGQRASEFAEYSGDLAQLKKTLDEILEARGRLNSELDRIRSLDELFTL